MSEKKYRLFGKIPVVDLLIVGVLLAALAGAVFVLTRDQVKSQTGETAQAQRYDFTATLMLEYTGKNNISLLKAGDTVYNNDGVLFGTVQSVEGQPYIAWERNRETGEEIGAAVDGYATMKIVVTGTTESTGSRGTFIGKKRLAIGNHFTVANEQVNWSMRVIDLEVAGQ